METYTSCRYLKLDSSLGTALNVFPSRYLVGETVGGQETREQFLLRRSYSAAADSTGGDQLRSI